MYVYIYIRGSSRSNLTEVTAFGREKISPKKSDPTCEASRLGLEF